MKKIGDSFGGIIGGLLLLIVGTVDWKGAFGIELFNKLHTKFLEKHVLSKIVVASVSFLVIVYNLVISIIKKKKNKKNDKLMTTKRLIVTICFGVVFLLAFAKIMLESVFHATDILNRGLEMIKVAGLIDKFTFKMLLGTYGEIGTWSYNDYFPLMIILAFVLKYAYHIKFTEVLDNAGEGFKKVLLATKSR